MQCRCRRIVITRQVVDHITDDIMYEICRMLMNGCKLVYIQKELELPHVVLEMFIEEIRRLLLNAGVEIRGND